MFFLLPIPSQFLKKLFLYTFFWGLEISLFQQQESWRLRQEGESDDLEEGGETVETEQPGPVLLRAEELSANVKMKHLVVSHTEKRPLTLDLWWDSWHQTETHLIPSSWPQNFPKDKKDDTLMPTIPHSFLGAHSLRYIVWAERPNPGEKHTGDGDISWGSVGWTEKQTAKESTCVDPVKESSHHYHLKGHGSPAQKHQNGSDYSHKVVQQKTLLSAKQRNTELPTLHLIDKHSRDFYMFVHQPAKFCGEGTSRQWPQ